MTDSPERLPEMTIVHAEVARVMVANWNSERSESRVVSEILSVIQSLASQKYVLVEREEIERLLRLVVMMRDEHRNLVRGDFAAITDVLKGWLSSAPPTGETK